MNSLPQGPGYSAREIERFDDLVKIAKNTKEILNSHSFTIFAPPGTGAVANSVKRMTISAIRGDRAGDI